MLCGCTNPGEQNGTSTTPHVVDKGDEGRRLVVPGSPASSSRRCPSVRVRPSTAAAARGLAPSEESLGLGAEATRNRSYTLTDGATSAIGRILTCFQDAETSSSDDLPRSRPRSRSLWSRRRPPPVSCLKADPPGVAGGCVVDVVLDCSPGTVRRRRMLAQSVGSTSSTLHSDSAAAAVCGPAKTTTSPGSEASSELTATSSEPLSNDQRDHPVWERRQLHRGRRRQTEPVRQPAAVSRHHNAPVIADIPPARHCSNTPAPRHDRSRTETSGTPSDAASAPRRVVRRAITCAVPQPHVRVILPASGSDKGDGHRVKMENGNSINPTTTTTTKPSLVVVSAG